eukprot:COSAG02_NODE_10779_length_1859_cov_3.213068_1_plen_20_part_10
MARQEGVLSNSLYGAAWMGS